MDIERVIVEFIARSYDFSGGYVINKERDFFAYVETYREYIEEDNEWIEYAAVDYLYFDRIVKAIRNANVIGEGSCSVVDECYTDGELIESMKSRNITTIKEAMEHFQAVHKGYHGREAELEAARMIEPDPRDEKQFPPDPEHHTEPFYL
jgi:hypothetical protein